MYQYSCGRQLITFSFGNIHKNMIVIHYIGKGKPQLVLFLVWDVLLKKAWHYPDGTFESIPDIMSC